MNIYIYIYLFIYLYIIYIYIYYTYIYILYILIHTVYQCLFQFPRPSIPPSRLGISWPLTPPPRHLGKRPQAQAADLCFVQWEFHDSPPAR